MINHLQRNWYAYFMLGAVAVVLPPRLAELPLANVMIFFIATAVLIVATFWASTILKQFPAFGEEKLPRDRLFQCALMIHLGLTAITVASTLWSVPQMLILNLGLPPIYVGMVRMGRRCERSPVPAPMPWKGLALDYGMICAGVGVLALAQVI